MTWTGRSDKTACCGDDPGPVDDDEVVVRLLHSGVSDPPEKAFRRDELAPKPTVAFSNACGESTGVSVDRAGSFTDEDLRGRAADYAAQRGRDSRGAWVANVAALRAIESDFDPEKRAVYVYDDPRADNRHHAVIRISASVPRTDLDEIREAIMAAFSTRIVA